MTEVYLEIGKRRVFACARQWPGWCRPGRGEGPAMAALAAAAPRYAVVSALAGVPFDAAAAVAGFEIAERVTGTATTDFGALDVAPAFDGEPATAQQAERLMALTQAAWDLFEQTVAAAPAAFQAL
jgi:polyisoprenoid-binding protein YceI